MLTKVSAKLDRFYIALGILLVFLAIFIVFIARGIFSSFSASRGIVEGSDIPTPHLNKDRLNSVYTAVYENAPKTLDLK